jgi:hypothetical protein
MGKIDAKPGKRVTVRGTARDAKAGAVIVTSAGNPIYIEHVDSWPKDVLGQEVEADGVLRSKKYIPDPVVDKHGAISQGAEGNQDVLEGARWNKRLR